MNGFWLIFLSGIRQIRHHLFPLDRSRIFLFTIVLFAGLAFVAGDFGFFWKVFYNILHLEDIPLKLAIGLSEKLISLVLISALSLLYFSGLISVLSMLYLDNDIPLLMSLPITLRGIIASKASMGFIQSSYMIALLCFPIAISFGVAFGGGFSYYILTSSGLFLFLLIPYMFAIPSVCLLVRFFPAKRVHQLVTVIGVILICLIVVLLRTSRPEALIFPEAASEISDTIKSISLPKEAYLPSFWLARVAHHAVLGEGGKALSYLGRLGIVSLLLLLPSILTISAFYKKGLTKASEVRGLRAGQGRDFLHYAARTVNLLPMPQLFRSLLMKDILTFFRDVTEWGQLFTLSALIVIYFFNLHYLPSSLLVFKAAIAFFNIAIMGFVVASLNLRFAYTALSTEGGSIWRIKSLPISPAIILFEKFFLTFAPLVILAVIIMSGSNILLHAPRNVAILSIYTTVFMCIGLTGLGVGLGAITPNFKLQNPLKMAMSLGGLFYLFLSILYIIGIIIFTARPIYHSYLHLWHRNTEAGSDLPSYLGIAMVSILIAVIPLRIALKLWPKIKI